MQPPQVPALGVRAAPMVRREPKYETFQNELLARIGDGTYPVGATLPTELELSAAHHISRRTVRKALEQIAALGMIERHPRIGTRVRSLEPRAGITQPIGSLSDLFQYLGHMRLRVLSAREVVASAPVANHIGCRAGSVWSQIRTLRFHGDDPQPIALSEVYVAPAYARVAERLEDEQEPVYKILSRSYGLTFVAVDQSISAVNISSAGARLLKIRPATACLFVVRRYQAADGTIPLASINYYPERRFAYEIRLTSDA